MKKNCTPKTDDSLADGVPRYLSLTEEMRRQVKSGILRPGDALPSVSRLQAIYGVSKNTIAHSHLLLEREGLIVREHGRGTYVSDQYLRRASQRTGIVGFYGLPEAWASSSSYWTQILEGAREALQAQQMHLLLLDSEAANVHGKADGALINGDYSRPQAQWREEKWPCVVLLTSDPGDGTSSVVQDVMTGTRHLTGYLLDLGHLRIAFLHNANDKTGYHLKGYHQALKAAGIAPHARWIHEFHDSKINFYQAAREAMREWIEDGWCDLGCTALMAHNDEAAAGAIEALTEAGFRVPHDVSVVGFDGIDLGEHTRPRLTKTVGYCWC